MNFLVSADSDLLDDDELIEELDRSGIRIVKAEEFLVAIRGE